MQSKEESELREQNWEQVQVKAFTAWLNSYLLSRGSEVKNLFTDLQDGVMLLHFLECVQDKKLPNRWDPTPMRKVQKLENLSIAVNYITNVMNVKLVGIGAEDIFEGHKKLILGLIWSLFRALRMTKLTQGAGASSKKAMEEALLRWVREQTAGYEGVNVNDFRYGFQDGLALAALINKFDPTLLDYNSAVKKDGSVESKQANLELAFSVAEKHMNIPRLLDSSDLLNGDPDERSVQLYVSMFFHAFTSKEEKERIEREKGKLSAEMDSIASSLAREEEERKRLLHEKEQLEKEQAVLASDMVEKEKKAAELEKIKRQLEDELADLRKRLEDFEALQRREHEMREKTEALEELLEKEADATEEELELLASLQEELEKNRKEVEALRAQVDEGDAKSLATKELASTREGLLSELEKLKKRLKKEEETRAVRERLNAKLKAENDELRRKAQNLSDQKLTWDLLQKNLEEHLEDLYCWREVQNDGEVDPKKRIDVTSQIKPSVASKNFAEQFALLNERLEEENRTLLKALNVKDTLQLKKDVVDKQGYLVKKGKKRFFVLKANVLSYYISEQTLTDIKGSIALSSCTVTAEPAHDKEKEWLLGISVEGRKLILQADSQTERDRWLAALNGSIAYQAYKEEADKSSSRPDFRLLNFFTSDSAPSLHLDDRPISLESITALANVLPFHDELTILSIENADLRDSEATILAPVLSKLRNLKVVKLGRNKLTAQSAVVVIQALHGNKSLKEVYLNDNDIGDEGVDELGRSLEALKSVDILDLSGNKLGDKGASSIVNAVSSEHNLKSLLLSKNSIGDEGASAIAGLLEKNSTLAVVQLQGNSIGDQGVIALARALQKNTSVSLLDISANDFSNSGAVAIHKLLEKNKVLEGVDLSLNKIHGGSDVASFLEAESFFFPHLTFSRRIKVLQK